MRDYNDSLLKTYGLFAVIGGGISYGIGYLAQNTYQIASSTAATAFKAISTDITLSDITSLFFNTGLAAEKGALASGASLNAAKKAVQMAQEFLLKGLSPETASVSAAVKATFLGNIGSSISKNGPTSLLLMGVVLGGIAGLLIIKASIYMVRSKEASKLKQLELKTTELNLKENILRDQIEEFFEQHPPRGLDEIQQIEPTEDTPKEYICPITRMIFDDPIKAEDGHYYERAALSLWHQNSKRCPLDSKAKLSDPRLFMTNVKLQKDIKHHIESYSFR